MLSRTAAVETPAADVTTKVPSDAGTEAAPKEKSGCTSSGAAICVVLSSMIGCAVIRKKD